MSRSERNATLQRRLLDLGKELEVDAPGRLRMKPKTHDGRSLSTSFVLHSASNAICTLKDDNTIGRAYFPVDELDRWVEILDEDRNPTNATWLSQIRLQGFDNMDYQEREPIWIRREWA
ncbi:hypothetical protein L6452_13182 [Arctium lappa]|uniref:Uncharacterized protein n=1 Tax=Arctium lappa TaxID=4217 RepID=A0ACB9CHU9_ARCLA|nr:hypothetical protein L6452_13182 [Arctium lappa]